MVNVKTEERMGGWMERVTDTDVTKIHKKTNAQDEYLATCCRADTNIPRVR